MILVVKPSKQVRMNIIRVEPGNEKADVAPELPPHGENDGEVEEGFSGWMFGGGVASDGDDTDVE
jgi:hypothetical protein